MLHTGLHEDIERLERIIVKDFKRDMKAHREKLMQNHRVKRRLQSTEEASRKLVCVCVCVFKEVGAPWHTACGESVPMCTTLSSCCLLLCSALSAASGLQPCTTQGLFTPLCR